MRHLTSNKASNSTCIDAVVGEQNIADYWRQENPNIFFIDNIHVERVQSFQYRGTPLEMVFSKSNRGIKRINAFEIKCYRDILRTPWIAHRTYS